MKKQHDNNYCFLDDLANLCEQLLQKKDRLMICVTAKSGVGKSTFGRFVRKNGFGNFSKYIISVIDDSAMTLDLFYLFRKRIKAKSQVKDELKPFMDQIPKRKKIVFYLNTTPQRRLSKADIMVNLVLADDDERIERLKKRGDTITDAHYVDTDKARQEVAHDYYFEYEL